MPAVDGATTDTLHYGLLGPLTVERDDGVPVELGSPKQRAVLAVLLLHRGTVVSTDRLVDALWGEEPPGSALASLQAYISNLRRALRDESSATSPIVRQPPGYLLDVPADRVDVSAFRTAATDARRAAEAGRWTAALAATDVALARWRGPVLDDLRDGLWVQAEAHGLDELRTECRETRVSALLAEGQLAPALIEARQLRDEDPLRERACWLHMVALYRAQRVPEALEQYREHAQRLAEELGLEPGEELRALELSILRQDPELAAWPRRPGWTGAAERHAPAPEPEVVLPDAEPAAGTLVGREREALILDGMLADARARAVGWLVLTGPAGIGKTRLAEELVARGRAMGGREAWARCSEEEGSPAWWPIRQLVRALGEDPDALLTPPAGVDSDGARFALYERVALVLQRVAADTPVLTVVVDDIQWADPTSARCLASLVGALRGVPIAVVLTLRDGEDTADIAPLFAALARADGHRQVAVPALLEGGVAELAARVAGAALAPEEVARLAERTGGNPLFVSEYARLSPEERAGDGIPLAVRSVVGGRLAGLDPAVLQVLRAAAAIGDVLDLELLVAVTRLDLDALADLLDEAADEHIIVASARSGGYAFAHGLIREEVLAATPALRRQRLHARIAEALADATDGDRLTRRAQHLVAALPLADPAEVLAACRAAAEDAERRWSSDTAAIWWLEALRAFDLLPPDEAPPGERDDLLVARVEALARAGLGQSILDAVDAGLRDAAREGRTSAAGRLAASLLRSTGAWPWVASGEDAGPLRERLAASEPFVAGDPAARVRLEAAISVGSSYHPDGAVLEAMSAAPIALAETLGDPDVLADALLGRLLTYSGVSSRSRENLLLVERIQALPHAAARVDAAIADSVATMAQMNLGDVDAVEVHLRRAVAESDLLRLPSVLLQLRWMQGTVALWRGDLPGAERRFVDASAVHRRSELHSSQTTELGFLALAWERGTLADTSRELLFEPTAWEAAIAAARGEHERASALVEEWVFASRPEVWFVLGHQVLLAHVAADLGLARAAERLAELLAPHEDRIAIIGQVASIGSVALAAARLQILLGDEHRARARLAQARALAERTGGAPTLLRCRLLDAQLTAPGADRDAVLAAVAADAERLGMLGVAASARAS